MSVLVDSSVWIQYFRGQTGVEKLDWLIDEGLVAVNDLIVTEILPPILIKKQTRLAVLLREIPRLPMNIDWQGLTDMQVLCLKHGINKVGIPDLIVAQNALQHRASLFSLDRHLQLLAKVLPLGFE
ncbi:MAG TPA: PIN domain nuclease [Verrucomicrobia bacterium]|nr:MAG: twitching motility protein PilT [Lentisphaerae bacterium GWF2_57_35]HBA84271.1 PIN domain nuclease [Verrucomicrobiota bacterium]